MRPATRALIGQGREAEVFEWQDGRVLKLLRASGPSPRLAFEIAALEAARSAGISVPQVYEEVVIDGRAGIVMERLEGADLLTIMGQKPWLVFRSGRVTGEMHAQINAARAPTSLPAVRDVVSRGLARLSSSEPALADWAARILADLPDGEALCHGDFHPGQLMFSGGRYKDQRRLRRWEIVNLAVRALDEIPGERPRLIQRFQREWARRDAP